jgi:hypothetical protein
MRNRCVAVSWVVLWLAALASCGGGGSGGSGAATATDATAIADGSTTEISVSPQVVEITYPGEGQLINTPTSGVAATIKNLPAGPVFPVLVEDAAVLTPGPVQIQRDFRTGTYDAFLTFSELLATGIHRGNFTFMLCQDPACAAPPYAVATVPYTVTITPPIKITALVNGIAADASALRVAVGAVVTLQSSMPVFWNSGFGSGADASDDLVTPTLWRGTIRAGSSRPASMRVQATQADLPPNSAVQRAVTSTTINVAP